MALGGDSSAEAVGMPGGAAGNVPVCLVLWTASVTVGMPGELQGTFQFVSSSGLQV